jgi:Mg2+ and Co2+ transporter CorA
MSSTGEFERYLSHFRLRLKKLVIARGASILAAAALLITIVAVSLAIRRGFPGELVIAARFFLFAALGAIAWWLIVLPSRRMESDGSEEIEARTPDFAGRIMTWVGIKGETHPLAELLAEDSLKVASKYPPESQVPRKEFSLFVSVTAVAAAALLFLAIAGPGNYAYGVRHLWFGWAFPGLLPPQSIEVLPGDDGIRLGGTVNVKASMQGFDPADAYVHARFGDAEWQQVEMAELSENFEFTFFSVRQPLEYYVSAANVRSETYSINVVDLPVIENLVVTYRFPEWTGKDDETKDPGGDVRAIPETEIVVEVSADRPMTPGELVVDDQLVPLSIDGETATASFTVEKDGQYFVAARVGGEQIRLTDDYFVTMLDDELPEIEFSRPGRDWSASSIEEVTAHINASDDFRLESLELRYSVNGGDWSAVEMPVDANIADVDHVFFLESLSGSESLVPGDLVSYYAVAGDRENSARTDIFFIDVQPFDRRYSQSQQAGGQMGGQGQQQSEISQRQKEIIVSTWNLIREQQEGRRDDPAYVSDNAALLSRVQATLREQVETLARRTEARQLTASGEEIARFVQHLESASEAMVPAAERLGEIDLEQAILPEQEALQHLLAAEAVFTDISVSMQANNGGGGGGQAGRDLTEMFELEMDLEKNQYETGSRATPDAPQQQLEETANELEELARRQEQLARNMNRNQQATTAQRWQQEMLRREVEELRQRLERMQEQQSASNQQQGQQGQQGQPGQGGSQQGQPDNRQIDELRRRLESAVRAMNDADEAMRNGGTPEDMQRAASEAQRQLEGARDQATAEMQRAMQASLDDLAERSEELFENQEAMENRLQQSIRGVNVGRNDMNRLESGMSILEEYEFAEEKRQLQAGVQQLEQDARNTAQQIAENEPEAAEQIRDAIDKLREDEVETRIAVAAAYIEQGEAVYVAGSESAVTEALRELQEDMARARSMVRSGEDGENGEAEGQGQRGGIARTLAETRELRRELQQLAEGNANSGNAANRGRDDLQQSTGVRVDDLETTRDFDQAADEISDEVLSSFRELGERGVPVQDIDELRRLAADIRASNWSGNPALLEQEARRALSTVEQLEMALARVASEDNSVRTNTAEEIPDAHREIVADYYRRLGEADDATDQ